MEYSDDGDLYQKIVNHQKNHTMFDEDARWRTLIQVLKGLSTLHELNIFHRDLKVKNTLLRVQTSLTHVVFSCFEFSKGAWTQMHKLQLHFHVQEFPNQMRTIGENC